MIMEQKTIIIRQPGDRKIMIPFAVAGEEKEIKILVRAKNKGSYGLELIVNHEAVNTKGKIIVRGVALNGANVKLSGLVKIGKKAAKTENFLSMKMLLLDEKSMAVVEPKMEIENNEVKAAHAATVGKLDEEQIFYLVSRGMTENEARKLLIKGFLKG